MFFKRSLSFFQSIDVFFTTPNAILFLLCHLPTKNNNIAEIIIRKGPFPGKVIPKLDTRLEGSRAPEINGDMLIKINIKVGYNNLIIAENLKLMKFNCELIIVAIKKMAVKKGAISPKYNFQVYKLLKI